MKSVISIFGEEAAKKLLEAQPCLPISYAYISSVTNVYLENLQAEKLRYVLECTVKLDFAGRQALLIQEKNQLSARPITEQPSPFEAEDWIYGDFDALLVLKSEASRELRKQSKKCILLSPAAKIRY